MPDRSNGCHATYKPEDQNRAAASGQGKVLGKYIAEKDL